MQRGIGHSRNRQAGLSIAELLVGMVIGLLLTVIILQVVSVVSMQSRTTSGAADAQTSGNVAIYTIERDIQMAGYGLIPDTASSALECNVVNLGASGVTGLNPVTATDGVAAPGVSASDTLIVRYGNSQKGGNFTQISAAFAGNNLPVVTNLGCRVNDVAMVVNGAACSLSRVTGPADLDMPAIASTTTVTLADLTTNATLALNAAAGANFACLGTWTEAVYSVSNGNLMLNGTPIFAGIVNLQVQYGISASANSNVVTQWVDPSGATWAAPTLADRNRIKSIRVALVARSDQLENENVTAACSSTTASSPTGLCAWEGTALSPAPAIDLSQGDASWQRYRYRVYESTIPIRNMIWARDVF